ncbi:hypothetical protein [Ilumatobacter sp.]|uniref:hypothetical protein n=1 Tax=Ilumatobacter sp. TaxID=1967498 RepID=UPI003C6245ED
MTTRQQVLYLWLDGSSLDEKVVGWAFHDGTDGVGPQLPDAAAPGKPPYANGVGALRDGWMLLQSAQLVPPAPGQEHVNSYLEYEFVLERRVTVP